MSFGQRLKHLRKQHKLTRENLAKKLKISYWALSKYETDARIPDPETFKKIADFFNVSTDYLLGRTDNPNGNTTQIKDLKHIIEGGEWTWDGKNVTVTDEELEKIVWALEKFVSEKLKKSNDNE